MRPNRLLGGMDRVWLTAVTLGCAVGLVRTPGVHGHAYLMAPVSRNLWYTTAFQTGEFSEMIHCPHCYQSRGPGAVRARGMANTPASVLSMYGDGAWPLKAAYDRGELAANGNYLEPEEISVRHGICGDPEQTAAEGTNVFGRENSVYPVLETYVEGSVIEMKVVMSTYHNGHLEMFICDSENLSRPEDGPVTQSCFNKYPLTRAQDDGNASPIDPEHSGRYFVDPPCRASETDQTMLAAAHPGDVVTARYQLPEGLTCQRCILQMVYYTGNSCTHPGYREFDGPDVWPSECAPTKGDWIPTETKTCGEGDAYPEEFWNCADISITADGKRGNRPTPSPRPTLPSPGPRTQSPHQHDQPQDQPTHEEKGRPKRFPRDNKPGPTPDGGLPAPESEDQPSPAPDKIDQEPVEPPRRPVPDRTSDSLDGYSDPIEPYEQCGGGDLTGSEACRRGYECVERVDGYSECHPKGDVCAEHWTQCGGFHWDGPTCCWPGHKCEKLSDWYWQCVLLRD